MPSRVALHSLLSARLRERTTRVWRIRAWKAVRACGRDSGSCQRRGLIALAPHGRFGVDVEERFDRLVLDGMSEIVFGLDEQADFASVRGGEKFHLFFTLWTFKETLRENLGTGFALDPYRLMFRELYDAAQEKASSVFPRCRASNGDSKT